MQEKTSYDALEAACASFYCTAKKNEPMKNHTTFRVGGPARMMLFPETEAQLANLISEISKENLPAIYLGKGSNLLVRDGGIDGVVIKLTPHFGGQITVLQNGNIYAPAGKTLSELCTFALKHELSGLEFAYGIPGTVGGAIYMNAGAYGGEIKDVLGSARYFDGAGKAKILPASELNLSYRHSFFGEAQGEGTCIIGGEFVLNPGDKEKIRSAMDLVMWQRRMKQPMEVPSAGSTFKRPEGAYASALIDQCGLKGFKEGGAAISEKHAGFVVNIGDASCKDILNLIEKVKNIVFQKTGYKLENEIKIMGVE